LIGYIPVDVLVCSN